MYSKQFPGSYGPVNRTLNACKFYLATARYYCPPFMDCAPPEVKAKAGTPICGPCRYITPKTVLFSTISIARKIKKAFAFFGLSKGE